MGCSSSLHNKELVSKVNISNNLSDAQKIAIQMTLENGRRKSNEDWKTNMDKVIWL